eukprot:symbB.v1.2.012359.t2/scaffold854.1/size229663/13
MGGAMMAAAPAGTPALQDAAWMAPRPMSAPLQLALPPSRHPGMAPPTPQNRPGSSGGGQGKSFGDLVSESNRRPSRQLPLFTDTSLPKMPTPTATPRGVATPRQDEHSLALEDGKTEEAAIGGDEVGVTVSKSLEDVKEQRPSTADSVLSCLSDSTAGSGSRPGTGDSAKDTEAGAGGKALSPVREEREEEDLSHDKEKEQNDSKNFRSFFNDKVSKLMSTGESERKPLFGSFGGKSFGDLVSDRPDDKDASDETGEAASSEADVKGTSSIKNFFNDRVTKLLSTGGEAEKKPLFGSFSGSFGPGPGTRAFWRSLGWEAISQNGSKVYFDSLMMPPNQGAVKLHLGFQSELRMIEYEDGFLILFRLRGSVFPMAFLLTVPSMLLTAAGCLLINDIAETSDFISVIVQDDFNKSQVWSALTASLSLLIAFRTRQALQRFWEGTTLMHQMRGEWFDSVSCLVSFSRAAKQTKPAEVKQFRDLDWAMPKGYLLLILLGRVHFLGPGRGRGRRARAKVAMSLLQRRLCTLRRALAAAEVQQRKEIIEQKLSPKLRQELKLGWVMSEIPIWISLMVAFWTRIWLMEKMPHDPRSFRSSCASGKAAQRARAGRGIASAWRYTDPARIKASLWTVKTCKGDYLSARLHLCGMVLCTRVTRCQREAMRLRQRLEDLGRAAVSSADTAKWDEGSFREAVETAGNLDDLGLYFRLVLDLRPWVGRRVQSPVLALDQLLELRRHTLVRLASVMHGSALDEICGEGAAGQVCMDITGLDIATLKFLRDCTEIYGFNKALQHMMKNLVTYNQHIGVLTIPPPILSRVYQTLSRGFVNLLNAKKIADTRFPFPWAQIITLLILSYSITTPLVVAAIVKQYAWAVMVTFIPVFSMISLNLVCTQLEMPFGTDANDLPLQHFQLEMNRGLLLLIHEMTDHIVTTRITAQTKHSSLMKCVGSSAQQDFAVRSTMTKGMPLDAVNDEVDEEEEPKSEVAQEPTMSPKRTIISVPQAPQPKDKEPSSTPKLTGDADENRRMIDLLNLQLTELASNTRALELNTSALRSMANDDESPAIGNEAHGLIADDSSSENFDNC